MRVIRNSIAIFCTNEANIVNLVEYQVDNLEAYWCNVMANSERIVLGSVYINVGKIGEIGILEQVITRILSSYQKLIVCLDANSRSLLWDPSCIHREKKQHIKENWRETRRSFIKSVFIYYEQRADNIPEWTFSRAVDMTLSQGLEQRSECKMYIMLSTICCKPLIKES